MILPSFACSACTSSAVLRCLRQVERREFTQLRLLFVFKGGIRQGTIPAETCQLWTCIIECSVKAIQQRISSTVPSTKKKTISGVNQQKTKAGSMKTPDTTRGGFRLACIAAQSLGRHRRAAGCGAEALRHAARLIGSSA